MTIPTGVMQLLKAEPLDVIEDFENGLAPDGGEWTNWERLSAHNHGGGLLGAPITVTAAMIPDGSITAGKLDPSVLAPYALTDGSKPFTGQVTMAADAVIRDALLFGEQGTALAPDVRLARSGAPGGLGIETAPSGGSPLTTRLTLTQTGTVTLSPNAGQAALVAGGPIQVNVGEGLRHTTGDLSLVSSSNNVVIRTGASSLVRASVGTTGTLSLTPDAGQRALEVSGAISNPSTHLVIRGQSGYVVPDGDGGQNMGNPTIKWGTVYAAVGTINTSLAEAKTGITPLDPAAALAAVRATTPVTFDYRAPAAGPEAYDLPPDPEQAQAVLEQRLRSGPLETAARHQAGVVLGDPAHPCDPLFQTGEGQTNASNSVGILLAALKNLDSRLTSLGG